MADWDDFGLDAGFSFGALPPAYVPFAGITDSLFGVETAARLPDVDPGQDPPAPPDDAAFQISERFPVPVVCNPEHHAAYVRAAVSAAESATIAAVMGQVIESSVRAEWSSAIWAQLPRARALPAIGHPSSLESWVKEAGIAAKRWLAWELAPVAGPLEHYIYDALGTSYERVAKQGTLYRICIVLSVDHQLPGFARSGMPESWCAKWDAIEARLEEYVARVCARTPTVSLNYVAFIVRNFGRCTRCSGPIKEERGRVAFSTPCSLGAVPIMQCVKCWRKAYVSTQACPPTHMGCSFGDPIWYRDPVSFQRRLHGVRGHAVLCVPASGTWAYGMRCAHQSDRASDFLVSPVVHHDGSEQVHRCSACAAESKSVRATKQSDKDKLARWVISRMVPAIQAIESEPDPQQRARIYAEYVQAYDANAEIKRNKDGQIWGIWRCMCPPDKAPRYRMSEATSAAGAGAECLCVRCLCLEDPLAPVPNFVYARFWSEGALDKVGVAHT